MSAGRLWFRLRRALAWLDAHRDAAGVTAVAIVLLIAGFALYRLLAGLQPAEVVRAIAALPVPDLLASLLFTAFGYLALVGYDWSALRYVGRTLPLRVVALASFCGYAIGNTAGFTLLTGGSVRFRIYSAAGLRAGEIVRVALFCVIAFGFGISAVSALGVLARPGLLAHLLHVPVWVLQLAGIGTVAAIAAWMVVCARRHELRWRGIALPLPSASLTAGQLGISALDLCFAAAALYALLPTGAADLTFTSFLPLFCAAIVLGILSHVPGGLGVFEAVLVLALGGELPKDALVAALVVYRLIYFILPLLLATLLLALNEMLRPLRRRDAAASPPVAAAPESPPPGADP